MTDTSFQDTVLLLRESSAWSGEAAAWQRGRIQSWVIGAAVLIAVLLSAAAYF